MPGCHRGIARCWILIQNLVKLIIVFAHHRLMIICKVIIPPYSSYRELVYLLWLIIIWISDIHTLSCCIIVLVACMCLLSFQFCVAVSSEESSQSTFGFWRQEEKARCLYTNFDIFQSIIVTYDDACCSVVYFKYELSHASVAISITNDNIVVSRHILADGSCEKAVNLKKSNAICCRFCLRGTVSCRLL